MLFRIKIIYLFIIPVLAFAACKKQDVTGAKLPGTTNRPCSDIPRFTYMGQVYNTIKIGTQCWMRENLNAGIFTISTSTGSVHSDLSDNELIEKYCYDNQLKNCDKYGGLYDWNEMMNYSDSSGAKGICPSGWHIPTDQDFYELERWIDRQIPDPDSSGWRGLDAGRNLMKGYTSGFDALFGGMRYFDGTFQNKDNASFFWTSSETSTFHVYYRSIYTLFNEVYRNHYTVKESAFSVRCIKN